MQALQWLHDYSWAQQGLVAGIAIGTVCSLLSVIVVLKRMAFIGEGISHAAFGGVGTAIFLGLAGFTQDVVLFVFCLATAISIGFISRRRRVEADSAIGIALVAAMAWGVLMTNLRMTLIQSDAPWYHHLVALVGHPGQRPPSFEQLLFGSLVQVDREGMWLAVGLAAVVIVVGTALFKEIVFYAFDESASRVFGVRTGLIYYTLLTLLSLTIVVSIRLAGVILVTALLVIPGSTALMISRRLGTVLTLSWLVGVGGTVGGLFLSLEVGNLSTGACVVAVLCVVFAIVFASKSLSHRVGAMLSHRGS